MKPVKRSVAVVVRSPAGGAFLMVRRPFDEEDLLAGVWGVPGARLAYDEATLAHGPPPAPQPDTSMTQYTACRYTADPESLAEAAARGSLCAQIYLEDNSKKRLAAGDPLAAGGHR